MTRAERRRLEKAANKKEAVYQITESQLKQRINEGIEKELEDVKDEIYSQAVNDAMILTLTLPMLVLVEDYWSKSFLYRAPVFVEKVFEKYEKWQDGEFEIEDLVKKLKEIGHLEFKEKA